MSDDRKRQKLLAAREKKFQKSRTASAQGRPVVQYGRPAGQKWSTVPGSRIKKPVELPDAPVVVVDSQPVMLEDVRLETLDTRPG